MRGRRNLKKPREGDHIIALKNMKTSDQNGSNIGVFLIGRDDANRRLTKLISDKHLSFLLVGYIPCSFGFRI